MRRCALIAILLGVPRVGAALTVEPNPIRIAATFHGLSLRVSGAAAPGTQVFVSISGAALPELFNRKGRLGPLWANVGSVTVSGAPHLFLIAGITPAATLPRALVDANRLDLEATVKQASLAPAGADDELLRREYRRLKESWGAYRSFERAIRVEQGSYRGELFWPDGAPPGTYRVEAVHLREGEVVRRETAVLQVELVGLPGWIAHLAFERSAIYGAMSVVIALAVGFLMGLVFKKGGGH